MGLNSWFKWQGENLLFSFLTRLLWPRTSAGTVVVENGKMLVLDLGDYLTLPAGGSDKGESFEETAIRETREETGLKVKICERVRESTNSVGGVEVIFSAEVAGGDLEGNLTEGEPKWIDIEEAMGRDWRYNRNIKELIEAAGDL